MVLVLLLVGGLASVAPRAEEGPTVERASVSATGEQAAGKSSAAGVSGDGRYVAFYSDAPNLVPSDRNGEPDTFVRDLQTGAIERVSVSSAGTEAHGAIWDPSKSRPVLSFDGRFVAFTSSAGNLVPADTNSVSDIFVRDRALGTTTLVSRVLSGRPGSGGSYYPSISRDGRFISFHSSASDLVSNDTNEVSDVFVRDMMRNEVERISVSGDGSQGVAPSILASIGGDGRLVAFESLAPNLVPLDVNAASDVFVHDRATGSTVLASVDSHGAQFQAASYTTALSADGHTVAFWTQSYVPGTGGEYSAGVFAHDLVSGTTWPVSRRIHADPSTRHDGEYPAVSADGRYVAYQTYSSATDDDLNMAADIILADRVTGRVRRISVSAPDAFVGSEFPALSGDARVLAFASSSQLIPGDDNGHPDVYYARLTPGPANEPPLADTVRPVVVAPLEEIAFNVTATDPNGSPWLAYEVEGLPRGAAFDDQSRRFTWRPLPDQVGSHTVLVRITDPGGLSNSTQLHIDVAWPNDTLVRRFATPT